MPVAHPDAEDMLLQSCCIVPNLCPCIPLPLFLRFRSIYVLLLCLFLLLPCALSSVLASLAQVLAFAGVPEALTSKLKANEWVNAVLGVLGGKGGGKPTSAQVRINPALPEGCFPGCHGRLFTI